MDEEMHEAKVTGTFMPNPADQAGYLLDTLLAILGDRSIAEYVEEEGDGGLEKLAGLLAGHLTMIPKLGPPEGAQAEGAAADIGKAALAWLLKGDNASKLLSLLREWFSRKPTDAATV